jgi:hypothetical protein
MTCRTAAPHRCDCSCSLIDSRTFKRGVSQKKNEESSVRAVLLAVTCAWGLFRAVHTPLDRLSIITAGKYKRTQAPKSSVTCTVSRARLELAAARQKTISGQATARCSHPRSRTLEPLARLRRYHVLLLLVNPIIDPFIRKRQERHRPGPGAGMLRSLESNRAVSVGEPWWRRSGRAGPVRCSSYNCAAFFLCRGVL